MHTVCCKGTTKQQNENLQCWSIQKCTHTVQCSEDIVTACMHAYLSKTKITSKAPLHGFKSAAVVRLKEKNAAKRIARQQTLALATRILITTQQMNMHTPQTKSHTKVPYSLRVLQLHPNHTKMISERSSSASNLQTVS